MLHVPLRSEQMDVYLHAGERRRVHLTSRVLSPDRWQHIALTADTRQHRLRLIVNGGEADSGDIPPEIAKINLNHQALGRESDGKTPQRYYRGAIDDVRIYDCALEVKEVAALCPDVVPAQGRDPRNVLNGHVIPDEGYLRTSEALANFHAGRL